MSTLKTNNLQLLDTSRNIPVSKIAEMNGGFSFRNKIVDGRFDFWYEGLSQTTAGFGSATMWNSVLTGSANTITRQSLVAGVDLPAVEVPSAKYFLRSTVTSVAGANNRAAIVQNLEFANTLAGKSATLSFYAKSDSVKNIAIELNQAFGTSGSAQVNSIGVQRVQLSTSWVRYSIPITIPSISNKTIDSSGLDHLGVAFWFDAGSSFDTRTVSLGQQSGTFDIACVQLEEGSVMTPFEELPIEVSQKRVERYYQYWTGSGGWIPFRAYANTGNSASFHLPFTTHMRSVPVSIMGGSWSFGNTAGLSIYTPASNDIVTLTMVATASGMMSANSTTGYFSFDARL